MAEGDVGVFMLEVAPVKNPNPKNNVQQLFRVYGSSQGFIKYDVANKTASDSFNKYLNIQTDLYDKIKAQTGGEIKVVKTNDTVPSIESVSKKKCCKFKIFKCKSKNKKWRL